MTIAREIVSALERLGARTPLPRIRTLHLAPRDADGTRAGEFCALELEDGTLGLSFVLLGDAIARLRAGSAPERVAGAGALDVARWYAGGDGADRILGFAAVNALTAVLYARAGYAPRPASDTIGELAPGPSDHVGMIGLFPPLVPRILATGARLTVVELNPRHAGDHDGWRVTLDPEALRACDKVLSTSTVLLNDTLDAIVERAGRAAVLAIVGPGASCLPDPLFARGVTLVGGTWAVDRAGLRDAILAGAPWGDTARKTAIRRADYPGFEVLLGRIAPA